MSCGWFDDAVDERKGGEGVVKSKAKVAKGVARGADEGGGVTRLHGRKKRSTCSTTKSRFVL